MARTVTFVGKPYYLAQKVKQYPGWVLVDRRKWSDGTATIVLEERTVKPDYGPDYGKQWYDTLAELM